MQLSLTLSEVLNYLLGSTTLVSIYLAWKSRKSTIKQAEASALEGVDAVYKKMVEATNEKYDEMRKDINEQKLTIENLEKRLSEYINQCSTCENNKIGKK